MAVLILTADVFDALKKLPDNSVMCCITSPPYWGLRDYGVDGQIGMEATLGEHIDVMVNLFREVRRVLHPEGILWMNYGDCYASAPNGRKNEDITDDDRGFVNKPMSTVGGVLKPKDLCMVPARVAIALQEDGWWIRSDIIWAKPNPMPESVTDRPAGSHEHIYMMTKSARYRYDAIAARQNCTGDTHSRGTKLSPPSENAGVGHNGWSKSMYKEQKGSGVGWRYREDAKEDRSTRVGGNPDRKRAQPPGNAPENGHQSLNQVPTGEGRNLRNWEPAMMQVWKIATRSFKEAHFATFPPELVERCLKASGLDAGDHVLDPFGGAGTTGLVADQMGFCATLIELNPEYVDIATSRLRAKLVRVNHEGYEPPIALNPPQGNLLEGIL